MAQATVDVTIGQFLNLSSLRGWFYSGGNPIPASMAAQGGASLRSCIVTSATRTLQWDLQTGEMSTAWRARGSLTLTNGSVSIKLYATDDSPAGDPYIFPLGSNYDTLFNALGQGGSGWSAILDDDDPKVATTPTHTHTPTHTAPVPNTPTHTHTPTHTTSVPNTPTHTHTPTHTTSVPNTPTHTHTPTHTRIDPEPVIRHGAVDYPTYDVRIIVDVQDIASKWPHDFLWSGEGTLVFDENTYVGGLGNNINLSPVGAEEGQPTERVELTINITDDLTRAALLRDPGPVKVIIRWIFSADGGLTWRAINRRAEGVISEPRTRGNRYSLTLEFESGRDDPPGQLQWSHEAFIARSTENVHYGGGEWIPELAAQTTIEWPPGKVLADFYERQNS